MATRLQDFREQYPQYSEYDDETLAGALKERYYPDLDDGSYREQMGLGPRSWQDFPKDPHGFAIDPGRPAIKNPDGSTSTERTVSIGFNGRQYNVPSIIDGKAYDPTDPEQMDIIVDSARANMQKGWTYPNFETVEEAEQAARARSGSIRQARDQWEADHRPGIWDRVKSLWQDEEKKPINQLDPPVSPRADFELDDTAREEVKAETDRTYRKQQPGRPGRGWPARASITTGEEAAQTEPRALLRDQLFAGFDEMRANRATADFFAAAENFQEADLTAQGLGNPRGAGSAGSMHPSYSAADLQKQYRDRVAAGALGDRDPSGIERDQAQLAIENDIAEIKGKQVTRMRAAIDKSTELRMRAAQVPFGKETRDMLEAETFGEAVSEFTDDPVMIVAETSLRSLPNMAEAIPMAIAGAITMGPGGFIAGMGTGAGMTEYRASFAQYLGDHGVDINNAEQMVGAAMDDELMRAAHTYSGKRSAIIGTISGLSGGIATKPLTPFIQNVVGRELGNVAAQTVVQSSLEGAGEALAQHATGEYKPGEIAAEITGSMAAAPIEVGAASVSGVRAQKQQRNAALIESEVNEMLGRGRGEPPPDTAQPPPDTDTAAAPTLEPGARVRINADFGTPPPGTMGPGQTPMKPIPSLQKWAGQEGTIISREESDGRTLTEIEFEDGTRLLFNDKDFGAVGAGADPGVVKSGDDGTTSTIPGQGETDETAEATPDDVYPAGDVFDQAPTDTRPDQASDNLLVRYRQVATEEINVGLDSIQSPSDAAHIFSFLRKRGQEAFYFLVTDTNGKPLNLIRHTEGVKDAANADPSIIVAAAANTPGAANIWYGHNHPSGVMEPSQADIGVTAKINKALAGTDIEFKGHLIVGAPDAKARLFGKEGEEGLIDITPARRNKRLQITTRKLRRRSPGERVEIRSPQNARSYANSIESKNALVLLDNRNQVIGVSAFSPGEMGTLREEGRVRRVLAALDASNASATFIVSEKKAHAKNLSKMLNNLGGIRVLDTFSPNNAGELESSGSAGTGIENATGGDFSMRAPVPRETGPVDPDDIMDAEQLVAEDQVEYSDPRLKRNFYRNHLQGMAEELTPGGGVSHIWDDNRIIGRTPSVNPEWFQNMNQDPDYRMTVDQVQKAINKAITGKKLGVREQRVIQALVDTIADRRLEEVDLAREQLAGARQRRSERRSADGVEAPAEAEIAGEAFSEDEYLPEMTADSRIIYELMTLALEWGVDEGVLETLAIRITDNQDLMAALEKRIDEQRYQVSTQADTPAAVTRPQTDTEAAAIGRDFTGAEKQIADEIGRRDEQRNAGEVATADRRHQGGNRNTDRRDYVTRLSMEELVDEMFKDPMTGIGNRRAYDMEAKHFPWQASIDADGLKWINDNLGHDAGDAMIVAIAEALDQAPGVEAYRIGGDEFYIAGDSKREVQAALTMAEGILANQTITSPNGSKQGVEITGAIGKDKSAADSRMEIEKKRKRGRAARGELPQGVELHAKGGKDLDMNPGTNYIPIIGHRGSLPIDANHNLVMGTTGRTLRIPDKPVRREHLIHVMRRYFGNRIYQGRVQGKMRLGFYRPGQGGVRLKHHNDIEVAAHEIAHFLDDRLPWISKLYKQHKTEVKSVSYDQTMITEGWAEFMRLWMTQDSEAMQRTPAFYDAFNQEAKKHPKLWIMLTDLQELMHAWTQQGARARGASKHANEGPSFYEQIRRSFPVNIFQSTLDGLRSIKTIAADLSDQQAPAVTDSYERLRLAMGGSNGVTEAAMFYGAPGWRADGQGLELAGDSLMDIFGDMWGDNDVAMYMIARRAQELGGQGRENLMRPDEVAAWLKVGEERPEVVEAFDRYQKFNDQILDFAEVAGILNAETREAFQEMNKSYVPFNRVIDSVIDGKSVKQGGNPFMRLKGGTQNINNIWDNIVGNTGHIIRMSMINDGKRTLLRNFETMDKLGGTKLNQQAGVYAMAIGKEVKPTQVTGDQVTRKAVEAMGISWRDYQLAKKTGMYPPGEQGDYMEAIVMMIDRMAAGMENLVTFFKFGQDPKGDNLDFYMDNGEKQWFEINDPNLMDTLNFLQPKGVNWLIGLGGLFSATLRRGVVAVPVFQIKNFARDTVNAYLLSRDVKVPAVRAITVVLSRMSKDPAYADMLLNGGGFANRSQGLQVQRKVIIDPTKLAAIYDRFMGRFENANRLAEYKAAREGGKTPRKAALLSREISTDFAMRGSSDIARTLAITVPFLNARAQGLYRIGRLTESGDQVASYALRGLALAGATMALYALNKDDERYKDMPEDIKDLYYVFFTGEGEDEYFLMPKAFESGMIFSTLPERMMEYAEQENGKEFADALGWMAMQTFHMDMTPQVFQPWQDLKANKNFADTPIIPWYLEGVDPGEQYTYYTSETVRAAAQSLGWSPIKTEYALRGYLGTLGGYGLAAADAMYRVMTDPADRTFGEDPTRGDSWKENILVKALIDPLVNEGPPRRTKSVTDLYDMIKAAEQTAATVGLHFERQITAVEGYLEDPEKAVEYTTNEALGNARSQMSSIRVKMDQIRQSKDMTGDEKRVELWELIRLRQKVARDAVIAIKEAQDREIAEQEQEQQQAAAGAQ